MQKKANILLTKQRIIEKMQIILGTSITAFSTSMVLLPNKISTGGFSGIGTAPILLKKLPNPKGRPKFDCRLVK